MTRKNLTIDQQHFEKATAAFARGKPDQASFWLIKCVEINPRHEEALQKLADIAYAKDDLAGAVSWIKQAYSHAPTQDNLERYGTAWVKLIESSERQSRATNNLPADHMLSVTEDPFGFTRDQITAFHQFITTPRVGLKPTATFVKLLATAAFLHGDNATAEQAFGLLTPMASDAPYTDVRLTPGFYQTLEASDHQASFARFPVVQTFDGLGVFDSQANEPILFLPSDLIYFKRFTLPFMRSIWAHTPTAAVHAHIVIKSDADRTEITALCGELKAAPLRITVETLPAGPLTSTAKAEKCYYHAIRFVRFHQNLAESTRPLWMLDVDALTNRDIQPLFARMKAADVGLRIRPGRLEPWHQFSACLVSANPTPAALRYSKLTALYLADLLFGRGISWGADQLALFGAYQYLRQQGQAPEILAWGPDATDVSTYEADSIFWFTAGAKKVDLASDALTGGIDTPGVRYKRKYQALL